MEPKNEFYAAILTPYLHESIHEMQRAMNQGCLKCDKVQTCELPQKYQSVEAKVQEQIDKYGYDPDNFNKKRNLETENFRIMLETAEQHLLPSPAAADLIIIGNTEASEEAVLNARETGVLVARYSIFYENASDYTGNRPEDVGYSFDMPKQVPVVKAFLENDAMLEAMLGRDKEHITEAIERFNHDSGLMPVLATPYLEKALENQRPAAQTLVQMAKGLADAMQTIENSHNN